MTNSDNKQKPEIAGHLGSGEGERRAGRSPSPGDIEGCHINPTCVWGKALMGSRTICSAELMPCAGYDTYIQPWKGEEDCFHISESPWTRREAGLLLKRVPVDDNQTRGRLSWCTLLISVPLNQGKSHPEQHPPSLAIVTSIGPDSSGPK